MSNFLSARDYEHTETSRSGSRRNRRNGDEEEFDLIAAQRGWGGQARRHLRFLGGTCSLCLAIAKTERRIDLQESDDTKTERTHTHTWSTQ